jgi:uncharacterized damage-inducible protein DinB
MLIKTGKNSIMSITLKQVLYDQAKTTYKITEKLFQRVENRELSWKPSTGENWMTLSQLLMHCSSFGCGKAMQGFVKGDWGVPKESSSEEVVTSEHIPTLEALPGVESVEQALVLLADDMDLALQCIDEVEEEQLLNKRMPAPWDGPDLYLFQHLLLMIAHLAQHKGQLYYYLKLMGKIVNSGDLWGV